MDTRSLIKTLARPAPTPGAVLSRNGSRLVRGAGDGCFTKRTRKRCRSRPATGLILSLPLLGAALLTVLEGPAPTQASSLAQMEKLGEALANKAKHAIDCLQPFLTRPRNRCQKYTTKSRSI
ncbi:apolipoprotein C-I [Manis javanica]|uniref:apolipoprotein C-I n=1 Tax=Manis javanica TaxID=9974 RepID=UPI003C6D210F